MDASIIIRTKNEAASILATLESLARQKFHGTYEIIVVDSGSQDETLDIVGRYNTQLLKMEPKDFTYGRSLNLGTSNARGALIVNLSAHCLPVNDYWLSNLILGFENKNIAAVYGKQISDGNINPFEACNNIHLFGGKRISFSKSTPQIDSQIHFSNSNCAIRKAVWHRFKFDEEAPYAEDILWQKNVIEAGYGIIYEPSAAVHHTHPLNINGAYRNSRACAYALAKMAKKRQTFLACLPDLALFLAFSQSSLLRNFRELWDNNYTKHLGIVPSYTMATWVGWLVGRIQYRMGR